MDTSNTLKTAAKTCLFFLIKDDDVLEKLNKIKDRIKKKLNIKFHSMPVYDEGYIKANVKEFNGVI